MQAPQRFESIARGMEHLNELPRAIRVVRHVWIAMRDGVRLSARIWLPEDAEDEPVPAILEYIPYRKNDGDRRSRDSTAIAYFAGHGYASVRVDMRGSGDSEGILRDEYLPQEQDDARRRARLARGAALVHRARRHVRASPGAASTALQIAARRPPQLKARDQPLLDRRPLRRRRPLHGRLRARRGHALVGRRRCSRINARPPDPAVVGERWRDDVARAAGGHPALHRGLARATSAATPSGSRARSARTTARSTAPVYAVGGWADGYTNAVSALPRRPIAARARA